MTRYSNGQPLGVGGGYPDPSDAGDYLRGDRTWADLNKAAVGLSNVDNTSDANKPISSATQSALDGKAALSHTQAISTITGLQAALDAKAAIASVGPDVIVEDQKSSGTAGGSSVAGAQIRTLNTLVRNLGTLASLSSNEVTLPAGTYYVEWTAPAYRVGSHQTRLFNATDATQIAAGSSASSNATADYAVTNSFGSTVLTLASSKAIRIAHSTGAIRATDGLGVATSAGFGEVYARMLIWRMS